MALNTNYTANFRPHPTTIPELEVQETEQARVRRVLGPQTQQKSGCTQDCNQGRACSCSPAKTPSRWLSWMW